jgi:hypothetical protein
MFAARHQEKRQLMPCVGRETRGKGNNGASTIARNDVATLKQKKKKQRRKKNFSPTWAELAAQSSTEQASSAAEAAAWERVIGKERRGSLGGAEKKGIEKFFFPSRKEKNRVEKRVSASPFSPLTHGQTKTFSFSTFFFFFFLDLLLLCTSALHAKRKNIAALSRPRRSFSPP